MSVNGSTAMDLSLTTFVARVGGLSVAACFENQNLSANIAASAATTASPAASRIRLRRNLGGVAVVPDDGVTAGMLPCAVGSDLLIAPISLAYAGSIFPALASTQCDSLMKYSSAGVSGAVSIRNAKI